MTRDDRRTRCSTPTGRAGAADRGPRHRRTRGPDRGRAVARGTAEPGHGLPAHLRVPPAPRPRTGPAAAHPGGRAGHRVARLRPAAARRSPPRTTCTAWSSISAPDSRCCTATWTWHRRWSRSCCRSGTSSPGRPEPPRDSPPCPRPRRPVPAPRRGRPGGRPLHPGRAHRPRLGFGPPGRPGPRGDDGPGDRTRAAPDVRDVGSRKGEEPARHPCPVNSLRGLAIRKA